MKNTVEILEEYGKKIRSYCLRYGFIVTDEIDKMIEKLKDEKIKITVVDLDNFITLCEKAIIRIDQIEEENWEIMAKHNIPDFLFEDVWKMFKNKKGEDGNAICNCKDN